MCTACMDIITLIHDHSVVTDPAIARPVVNTLREVMFARNEIHLSNESMAHFFVVLGGELLVWEEDTNAIN